MGGGAQPEKKETVLMSRCHRITGVLEERMGATGWSRTRLKIVVVVISNNHDDKDHEVVVVVVKMIMRAMMRLGMQGVVVK